jgi:hypothetical protein
VSLDNIETVNPSDFRAFLREHGFDWLTGESCAISQRILFDISPRGQALMSQWLGGNVTFENESWNHGGKDRGWRSIKLAYESIRPLIVFIMATRHQFVWDVQGSRGEPNFIAGTNEEGAARMRETMSKGYYDGTPHRVYFQANAPRVGLDNVHGWSGRHQ